MLSEPRRAARDRRAWHAGAKGALADPALRKSVRIQLAELKSVALPHRYALGVDQDALFARALDDVIERRCDPYAAAARLVEANPWRRRPRTPLPGHA